MFHPLGAPTTTCELYDSAYLSSGCYSQVGVTLTYTKYVPAWKGVDLPTISFTSADRESMEQDDVLSAFKKVTITPKYRGGTDKTCGLIGGGYSETCFEVEDVSIGDLTFTIGPKV